MKKAILPLGLSVLIVLLDQITKQVVLQQYTVGDTFVLIPGILEFCYLHNFGSVMGIVDNTRWPLIIGTTIAIIACTVFLFSKKCASNLLRYTLALIIGGGIGNWIDRVFLGYVVDFVRFPIPWFSYSFNVADVAVCLGCGLLILDLLLDWFRNNRQQVS